jgi:hypothetical protein
MLLGNKMGLTENILMMWVGLNFIKRGLWGGLMNEYLNHVVETLEKLCV